jgi:hypothetical protein
MSTTLSSFTRSDPVLIPGTNNNNEQSYKDMIKQLAAQAPEPYGAIPPLKRKQKRKRPKEPVIRRLSHVENWLAVDSKESLPDEEDLVITFCCILTLSHEPCRNLPLLSVTSFQLIFWYYHYICHHLH